MDWQSTSVPTSTKRGKIILDKELGSPFQAGISAALRAAYRAVMEENTAEFDALLARLD